MVTSTRTLFNNKIQHVIVFFIVRLYCYNLIQIWKYQKKVSVQNNVG